jgi:DDE superfamily endonuclease
VDHRKRFVNLTVGWPGSVADGRVWANSGLNSNAEAYLSPLPPVFVATKASDTSPTQQEAVYSFILADSAYPSTSRIVPTFKTTECDRCPITKKLNYKLASIRYYIENAFGICKGRFRLLTRPLECAKDDVVRAVHLITAIFTLHNFLVDINDGTSIEPEASSEEALSENDGDGREIDDDGDDTTRAILLRHIRWLDAASN